LPVTQDYPIRYIVGRGSAGSRQPELRQQALGYIENHIDIGRRRRSTSSIDIVPPSAIEHMEATHRMHRRLFYILPIIVFFAWLEMR